MVHFIGTNRPWKPDQGRGTIPPMTLASLLLIASAAAAATPGRLPMLSDDLEAARAQARARDLPLFVDVWAPW
jgi:hypothetical protein